MITLHVSTIKDIIKQKLCENVQRQVNIDDERMSSG